ncbi:MAG TPA: hypothetical protein DDX92_07615 [Flavobacteriales bacterium]|jgi:hypothetical protein|nr:hypothetical protein [Flavobacteriales bacterium]
MKRFIVIFLVVVFNTSIYGQCPQTKYGIVPVWPQGWTFSDKENWYQTMSDNGMGYLHSIYTWHDLDQIISAGQLKTHIDYIQHLKDDYNFSFHLLLRNPSLTYNAVPAAYQGMTFEDKVLTNAFYDFSVAMTDSFANVLDYLTIGSESDVYFELHPGEMDEYINVLSDIADYVHTNYSHIKFATTLTLYHGVLDNDTLWQSTRAFSDMLSVTYWPLEQDFTVRSTAISDMPLVISELINAADGKPVIIKEAGLPTSPLSNSSEQLQAEFAKELFRNTIDIDQIELVGWDFLADYDQAAIDYWVNFQQIYTPEFRAYIGSLGLLDTLGNPKPAYSSYINMLDSVCTISSIHTYAGSNELLIYPNPSNNTFHIQAPDFRKVEVFNMQGELLFETKKKEINLEKNPSGIYLLKILLGTDQIMRKIMLE